VPDIPIEQAVELLVKAVEEQLPADEIQEIYNDWFRGDAVVVERTDASPEANKRRVEQLVAYFRGSRYVEEVVELWELVFTKHRNVWYNEEDEVFHHEAEPTPYSTAWDPETE
jgi:hypothetical protein